MAAIHHINRIHLVSAFNGVAMALALGLLALLTILIAGHGGIPPEVFGRTSMEIGRGICFVLMPAGLLLGMVRPRAGGMITVLSCAGFYASHMMQSGLLPGGWVFPLIGVSGALLLAGGILRSRSIG